MNIKNYMYINQLCLKVVGLYPMKIMRYVICVSCVTSIAIPQIIMFYTHWNDLNMLMETGFEYFKK